MNPILKIVLFFGGILLLFCFGFFNEYPDPVTGIYGFGPMFTEFNFKDGLSKFLAIMWFCNVLYLILCGISFFSSLFGDNNPYLKSNTRIAAISLLIITLFFAFL
jgi:hypothetical protein